MSKNEGGEQAEQHNGQEVMVSGNILLNALLLRDWHL